MFNYDEDPIFVFYKTKFPYPGYFKECYCTLYIVNHGGIDYICAMDRTDKWGGTSITNAAEALWEKVLQEHKRGYPVSLLEFYEGNDRVEEVIYKDGKVSWIPFNFKQFQFLFTGLGQ